MTQATDQRNREIANLHAIECAKGMGMYDPERFEDATGKIVSAFEAQILQALTKHPVAVMKGAKP